MNILLKITYDGTNYNGFQIQDNVKTIQGEIEKALKSLYKQDIKLIGASRTDAGVHALGQYACFVDIKNNIPVSKIPIAINNFLDDDIIISDAKIVDDNFHPRYDAKLKTYEYKILNDKYKNPMHRYYTHFVRAELDILKMQIASKFFIGTHDFIGFSSSKRTVKTTIRTIYNLDIIKENNIIKIIVVGDGFLYNMVRIIAGTLINVGLGKTDPLYIKDIILSKNRNLAGKTAPPQGLTLVNIKYP